MDLKFIQLIDDLTKDGWKLSTNPMALEIQKDSDFIENIKYMSIKTKVHLLLQFAICSPAYVEKHKEMIQQIVNICIEDKDRWVSEIARSLLSTYATETNFKTLLDPVEQTRLTEIVTRINTNPLFSTPIPRSFTPSQLTFGKWKESIDQITEEKDSIKLRESSAPQVKGTVGLLRKRNQPETPSKPEDKKIRISDTTIKVKPKIKTVTTQPKVKETSDIALPSKIPTGSDTPFVPLAFDSAQATKVRLNYSMYKDVIEKPEGVSSRENLYCFAGLFVNILRKLGYDGIQNEVTATVADFLKGKVPERNWDDDDLTMDYLVSINNKERKIMIMRLCFKDFSWELIEELY